MNRAISDIAGTLIPPEQLGPLQGYYDIKVIRADGKVEQRTVNNIVTRMGLNRIARQAVTPTGSPFNWIAVGSQTAAHSLDSTQAGIGEVLRKAAASVVQSREWFSLQCTIGGAADSVTSVALDSAALMTCPVSYAITATSGGVMGNAANGLGVTLGGSDLLDLTVRIRVGSHDLSHST